VSVRLLFLLETITDRISIKCAVGILAKLTDEFRSGPYRLNIIPTLHDSSDAQSMGVYFKILQHPYVISLRLKDGDNKELPNDNNRKIT
jgi:hypothetical protein